MPSLNQPFKTLEMYLFINYSKLQTCPKNNSLTILHLNIRTFNKNFDELYEFLVSFRLRLDIICLTETRIKKDRFKIITISEHDFFQVDLQSSSGGAAVCVLINLNVIHALINT